LHFAARSGADWLLARAELPSNKRFVERPLLPNVDIKALTVTSQSSLKLLSALHHQK
jgi:hypothetical protein